MPRDGARAAARPRRTGARMLAGRDDGRDLRTMIVAALRELLRERRLDEITVLDVIETAGVSRASFYIYFESKYAVVAALAQQVLDEIFEQLWRPFFDGNETPSLAAYNQHWLQTLEVWRRHESLLVAAAAAWRTDPHAIPGWGELWSSYVAETREFIERARAQGEAPPGPDAEALAASLTWANENALYLACSGLVPEFADLTRLAETQSVVWYTAIFGTD